MYKWVSLSVGAVLLSGCALPVPFQIASWALDGISMLATQKSVTDHGISLVTQKDCAIWRGVTEGALCRVGEQSDVLVAEDAAKTSSVASLQATSGPRVVDDVRVSNSSDAFLTQNKPLQVRAVPTHALRAAWGAGRPSGPILTAPVRFATTAPVKTHALWAVSVEAKAKPVAKIQAERKPVQLAALALPHAALALPKEQKKPVAKLAQAKVPAKGIYFVIGSFRNPDNAQRLMSGNMKLSPAVLNAKLDGSDVYRVVVGPVPRGREKRLHRALARDGFPDTWAIRINPTDWQFAKLPMPRSKTSPEVATLIK